MGLLGGEPRGPRYRGESSVGDPSGSRTRVPDVRERIGQKPPNATEHHSVSPSPTRTMVSCTWSVTGRRRVERAKGTGLAPDMAPIWHRRTRLIRGREI